MIFKKTERPSGDPLLIVHGQLVHGGSERQLYYLLREFVHLGATPSLAISGELGYWTQPIRDLGVPVTLLRGGKINKLAQLRQLSTTTGCSVLLSWNGYTNPFGLAVLGLDIRRVGSFRYGRKRGAQLRRPLEWLAARVMTSYICNSQETASDLAKDLRAHQAVHYVPNAVESISDQAIHRARWRSRLNLSQDEMLVLAVGRIKWEKNFGRFAEAVALVGQATPFAAVLAGGDGDDRLQLERTMKALGSAVDHLHLVGEVDDARELMCAADVLVLTSDEEGMPNVVMEAMAHGVPCVVTPVNGVSTLIEHRIDGIVADFDPRSIADGIAALLTNEELRRRLGEAARTKMSRHFSPATSAIRVAEIVGYTFPSTEDHASK